MNTGWKRPVAAVLCAGLMIGSLAGCSNEEETLVDADATAMTINSEEVSAGLVNFAAHYVQAQYQFVYDMYFGDNSFSYEMDTDYTIGDMVKEEAFSQIEELIVVRQNAEDYDVSLTDEELATIGEAAEEFLASNDEDLMAKMSATKDTVQEYLQLITIEQKMLGPMTADVDTEVSDEEAAQRRVQYALIEAETEEDDEADDEDEEETEDPAWTAAMEDAYEKAEQVITRIEGGMDFDDALEEVDEDLYSSETTFGAESTSVDEVLITATDGVEDETLLSEPVEADSGYYVVYVISELDREATDEEKENIVSDRKDEAISEMITEWEDNADISLDENVLSTIVYDYNLELYEEEEPESDEDESDWYEDDEEESEEDE